MAQSQGACPRRVARALRRVEASVTSFAPPVALLHLSPSHLLDAHDSPINIPPVSRVEARDVRVVPVVDERQVEEFTSGGGREEGLGEQVEAGDAGVEQV